MSEALKLNTNITSLYLRGEKKNTKKLVSNSVIMSFNSSQTKKRMKLEMKENRW